AGVRRVEGIEPAREFPDVRQAVIIVITFGCEDAEPSRRASDTAQDVCNGEGVISGLRKLSGRERQNLEGLSGQHDAVAPPLVTKGSAAHSAASQCDSSSHQYDPALRLSDNGGANG